MSMLTLKSSHSFYVLRWNSCKCQKALISDNGILITQMRNIFRKKKTSSPHTIILEVYDNQISSENSGIHFDSKVKICYSESTDIGIYTRYSCNSQN